MRYWHNRVAAQLAFYALPLCLFLTGSAAAQNSVSKPPALGYAFPPAVRIAATTDVHLGGYDFTPDMQWFVHHDLIRLTTDGLPGPFFDTPPPYWNGQRAAGPSLPIAREVAAQIQVPLGTVPGLVRWQVANANGASATAMFYVSDDREVIEHRSRDLPQVLPEMPLGINGRLSRLSEVDRYELVANRDGWICIDVMARRLGSDFQTVLEVLAADGARVAELSDTEGRDEGLCFIAKAGERFTVGIRDADFRGDRSFVYRLGFRIEANLPDPIAQAADSAATKLASPVSGTFPITGPVSATVKFPSDGSEQRFIWHSEKEQFWNVQLESRSLGGRADVAGRILDPLGQPIGQLDDDEATTDGSLEFQARESGEYTCVARSLTRITAAAGEFYRFELSVSDPDFIVTVPQQIAIPSGGSAEIPVQVVRRGGFAGEIAISMIGQPEGVVPDGNWLIPAGSNETKLKINALKTSTVSAALTTFQCAGLLGDTMKNRVATARASGNLSPRSVKENRVDRSLIAMTLAAPFEVRVIDRDRQHEVSRGTTFLADVQIERKANADGEPPFAGAIRLETSANQQRYRAGILSTSVEVPAGIQDTRFPCFMPEWLATDLTQRMLIQGVAIVPDPTGRMRHVNRSADARITIILEGALLKVATTAKDIVAVLGKPIDIPLRLQRSPTFTLPATLELVVPEEIRSSMTAESLVFRADQETGMLRVVLSDDVSLLGNWELTIRATALQDGSFPVRSEVVVPIAIER